MRPFLLTTSWDDGSIYDEKLAELLLKYKLPATFYIPFKNSERAVIKKHVVKKLSGYFEIGGHTYSHRDLTKLSLKKAETEIIDGKKYLEDTTAGTINSFCYPKGRFNQDVKQLVGMSGFKYARTTKILSSRVGDKLAGGTTIKADLRYGRIKFPWEILALNLFKIIKKSGGIYHLWGHSWEIEENNCWDALERLFSYIDKNSQLNRRYSNIGLLLELGKNKKKYYESK